MWTENTWPTLYSQWLACQVAFDHAIDLAVEVKPVELAEFIAKFEVQVVIEPTKDALEKAKRDCSKLVLWTDRSKLDQGNVGDAVCWKGQSVFLGKNQEVLDAGLWAILKGLEIAFKILQERDAPVTIFCDSQKALKAIQQIDSCNKNRLLRNLIYQNVGKVHCNGHLITIRWIPDHTSLISNKKVDSAARNQVQRRGKQAKRRSLLAYMYIHIGKNLTITDFSNFLINFLKKIN